MVDDMPNEKEKFDEESTEPEETKKSSKKKPKEIKDDEEFENLDPKEEFLAILKSMGIKRGVQVLADVFFSGDVNNPQHLDGTLVLGGVSLPQRRLIISRYFGQSPEQLGVELFTSAKSLNAVPIVKDEQQDMNVTAAQMMKQRLMAAQNRAMIKELEKLDKTEPEVKPKKRVTERPLISRDGEVVMKDGIPVIERIITEGDYPQPDNSMANMLVLMKMMESKKEVAVANPNEKPSWAIELENTIKVNKAEEEKRRLEDELKREIEKREERETELKKDIEKEKEQSRRDIERLKEDHEREIDRQKQEIDYRLSSLKDSFDSEIKHRDTIDSIRDAYGERFDELKKDLDLTKKDIKSAVASEMTKTGSKMLDRMSQTADGVIQPMAEVVKEMYGTQIDMMRKQANLPSRGVPDTNEEELKKLV
ncbi:MAG: hypothetical protein O8C67_04920 [Candidatus Methanoperedens sp.]|nr:hypothetical protein [Candidatus Methanoperedens sp.]